MTKYEKKNGIFIFKHREELDFDINFLGDVVLFNFRYIYTLYKIITY